jgi:hypothetical protein
VWNVPHMIIVGISFLMYLHTSMDKQLRHGYELCSVVTTKASWPAVRWTWMLRRVFWGKGIALESSNRLATSLC